MSHYIVDAIHGPIYIPDKFHSILQVIVKTKTFQRLRHIKQVGLVEIVYPGATHSRFSHSVGTAYLASKAISSIIQNIEPKDENNDPDRLKEMLEKKRKSFIVAALLHDIGHGPFSHLFEAAFSKNKEKIPTHEEWGERIYDKLIQDVKSQIEDSEQSEILKDTCKTLTEAKKIYYYKDEANKKNNEDNKIHSFLHQLLDSQLDVDRFDYLLRDSHYCGVKYGVFDVNWIIANLKITNYQLVVKKKATASIEDYLFSRKMLYDRVSFHGKIRAYEYLMKSFLERIYKSATDTSENGNAITDYFYKLKETINKNNREHINEKEIRKNILKNCVDEYLELTDNIVWSIINNYQKNKVKNIFKYICQCLQKRLLPETYIISDGRWQHVKNEIDNFKEEIKRENKHDYDIVKVILYYDDNKITMYKDDGNSEIFIEGNKDNTYENISKTSKILSAFSNTGDRRHFLFFLKFKFTEKKLNEKAEELISKLLDDDSITGTPTSELDYLC